VKVLNPTNDISIRWRPELIFLKTKLPSSPLVVPILRSGMYTEAPASGLPVDASVMVPESECLAIFLFGRSGV
jgi:hypothetical protein